MLRVFHTLALIGFLPILRIPSYCHRQRSCSNPSLAGPRRSSSNLFRKSKRQALLRLPFCSGEGEICRNRPVETRNSFFVLLLALEFIGFLPILRAPFFCHQQRSLLESLAPPSLKFKSLPKIKKTSAFALAFLFRRRRDLNSRAGYPTYTLSRGASSANLSTSPYI